MTRVNPSGVWLWGALLSGALSCDRVPQASPRTDAAVDADHDGVSHEDGALVEDVHLDDAPDTVDGPGVDGPDVLDASLADLPPDRPVRLHNDAPPWWPGGRMMLPPPRPVPVATPRSGCWDTIPLTAVGFDPDSHSACVVGDWIYLGIGGDVGRVQRDGSNPVGLFLGGEGMYAGILGSVACGASSFYLAMADIYSGAIAIVEFEDPARPGTLRWERLLDLPSPERRFGGFESITASDAMIAWVWKETEGPYHLYVSGPHGENPRDLRVPYGRPAYYLHAWHDRLVFVSGGDIWLWTVGSDAPENLTNDDADQWYPWIEGDRIVWVDQRDTPTGNLWSPNNLEIYSFDLRTRTRTRITHDRTPAIQHAPTLSGDWVVWMDFRNAMTPNPGDYFTDSMEIWGYNFRTGREYQIQRWGRSGYPLVDGDRIYFNCYSGVSQLVTRSMPAAE